MEPICDEDIEMLLSLFVRGGYVLNFKAKKDVDCFALGSIGKSICRDKSMGKSLTEYVKNRENTDGIKLYYLNPESWTLGELTATYEGVGEFRFSYLGEIRYSFFKKEVIHQRKNRAKADQIEKLLLKINADIAKEKQKSNRYYQESAEILSNVNRKKPEDSR